MEHDEDVPRFEPWLGVMLTSVVPVAATMYLPGRFLMPLLTLTAALFAAGLVMLRIQTKRRRRERD